MEEAYIQPAPYRTDETVKSDLNRLMVQVDDTQIPISGQAHVRYPYGVGVALAGVQTVDQITDHSAPSCNEPSSAVTSKTWVLAGR